AVRIRARHHFRGERLQLLHRVDRDVTGAGDHAGLALDRVAADLEHLFGEVHRAVAGRLAPHERAAPRRALAGDHAGLVAVGDALVLAEQVADLARTDADVAG